MGSVDGLYFSVCTALCGAFSKALLQIHVVNEIYFSFQNYIIYMGSYDIKKVT
jgi:hypothetical protein